MTIKMKRALARIIISAVLFAVQIACDILLPDNLFYISAVIFLVAYAIAGYDVLYRAAKNIIHGKIFDENFLMSLATLGAIGLKEYHEAIAVMLFYQVGELFQSYAVNKSRRSVTALLDIRPDHANLITKNGIKAVSPDEVHIGDLISIDPGERIPLDGIITDGISSLDNSALTGESLPISVAAGDEVLSGSINKSGVLTVRVTSEYAESTVSRILELVENAGEKKARSENFITRFAAWYTPAVVICAVLLAIIPPLIAHDGSFGTWISRSLTFLVVSCPCALVISVPLSFFGGIGGASKCGILIKGGSVLETLEKVRTIVFDKTGTLTKGSFSVKKIYSGNSDRDEILRIAAHCEVHSSHPVAISIKNAYGGKIDDDALKDITDHPGMGVSAKLNGELILAGNLKLMEENGIKCAQYPDAGTAVYVAKGREFLGCIIISDEVKPEAKNALNALKLAGINNISMLTGDSKASAKEIGKELGIDNIHSGLLPADKVHRLEQIIKNKPSGTTVAYVGDGINDAPVLAMSDVGIAMGGLGSDAAIEAADIVIMTDELSKISHAIKISEKTMNIVRENIIFALGIKILVLILSALGITGMWLAVFADVGVAVLAIINAMRALSVKNIS